MDDNPSLLNRAKRKTITRKMILSLIDVTKAKGEPEREQMYWNAYHCQTKIISYTETTVRIGFVLFVVPLEKQIL